MEWATCLFIYLFVVYSTFICLSIFFFTFRIRPSSLLIPTGAVVGVGDSSAGVMCPWLDTLDSGLIVIGCDLDCDSDWLLLIVINSDYD